MPPGARRAPGCSLRGKPAYHHAPTTNRAHSIERPPAIVENQTDKANRSLQDAALSLTREFVHRFWDADLAWCRTCLTADFTWIGTHEDQYARTFDAFREAVERIGLQRINVILTNEEYAIALCSNTICAVSGRYLKFSYPAENEAMSQWQRLTFVWEMVDGVPKLRHWHVSCPVQPLNDDAKYPRQAGRQLFEHVQAMLRDREQQDTLVVRDATGTTHRIAHPDIVYLEAVKQRTIIHCTNRDVVVYRCLSAVLADLEKLMIRVHRSFAVNPQHVAYLHKNNLALDNGASIIIPAKRLADVKSMLMQP